ncbi:MAG: rhodanese-like domain-containing protein [Candidatus Thiodiazotropha lotti]|nr:sulfurtransferase [Candidatus Thiodiazotropha lotti]ODB92973.1 sulfurtransferase [Candidatus Thiodiazotropha endoloripes]MCG7921596.1 sulfurtransferase [Candidatus Thiodiazotropha lotti]MCG7929408.1 sulfurtransferase [Candidatus Thiodiazotropha lotti]MCG8003397.1 sulfurtransferase [Candidatus Thiodiazotropha lotti]
MKRSLLFSLLFLFTTSVLAEAEFLVDSDWLSEHIDDDNLVILEVRYHPHRYHTVGHIPGAIQVQRFKDLGDNQGYPLMRFPSRDQFQSTLRQWGVNDDSTLLLYDDSNTALTSRLFYLLDLYGFNTEQVKILNGGTVDWSAFEEMTTDPTPQPKPGSVTLKAANPKLFVEWTDVYDNIVSSRDPNFVLLDARPRDMYSGKVVKHSISAGHIPGAINIVSLDGTSAQKWRDDEAIASLYKEIAKDKTIYVYCHDGFRMSLTYLQLKRLGYTDVRLYNGGWSHWGNRLTLPVVEGEEPYSGDFAL